MPCFIILRTESLTDSSACGEGVCFGAGFGVAGASRYELSEDNLRADWNLGLLETSARG
jgi:hypothetical protein